MQIQNTSSVVSPQPPSQWPCLLSSHPFTVHPSTWTAGQSQTTHINNNAFPAAPPSSPNNSIAYFVAGYLVEDGNVGSGNHFFPLWSSLTRNIFINALWQLVPQLSLRSVAVDEDGNTSNSFINLQIFIPELQIQKCLTVCLDELVWDIKRKLFEALSQTLPQSFNFGLFLPPCDGRAGKFLLEDRPIRDYPFHDCVPYVELKYKKRVYKMLKLDEKALKQLHSKSNLKKFMDYVQNRNAEKVEKMCSQGLDPNFHDSQGDTPLTLASGIPNNREILVQLIGGGAHLDFRNSEGQTGMHKASFLSIVDSVKTLLELGASPNYRDPIGLTPLYYNMLTTDSNPECAEMLLSEAADICVQDMHANEPLHQACKNGLVHHVEHLLFYGSNINAQNVNGNTPLHVCAVNNRVDCARVLLYRGADSTILNKQAQTAVHVAHIVNNLAVAEVIQNHNPHNTAPFMGVPKYNTRRRMTNNQISRRRSLSHSSMCSMQSDRYQAPAHLVRSQPMNGKSVGISPSPSCSAVCMANGSTGDYGTLKNKYSKDIGDSTRTQRFWIHPAGANQSESEVDFEPSPTTPALQFFEGVETTGMAMRAGLRPGDFLLEINGIDVRCASHEQVVHFIHQAEDTITLKVITIEVNVIGLHPNVQQHYAPSLNGKINSASRNSGLPPMVPNRNPVTSLSFGRTTLSGGFTQSNNNNFPASNYQPTPSSFSSSECEEYNSGGSGPANQSASNEQLRCASVKSRPSAARRISAAELEHLMIRQGTSASQFQPIPMSRTPPKIKRSSNTSINSFVTTPARPESTSNTSSQDPADNHNSQHPYPLKSFNSSPTYRQGVKMATTPGPSNPFSDQNPPPPPPLNSTKAKTSGYAASHMPPPQPEIDYEPVASSGAAPPPPPPPPSNLLQKGPAGLQLSTAKPTTIKPSTVNQVDNATVNKSDCRGISAEALLNVKLKKVTNASDFAPIAGSATGTNGGATVKPAAEQASGTKKQRILTLT
uniref:PDZ domain-containing protein n=1 Tax=Ditylenchus dipsaci TaxID=166011 RepID=A0A915EUV0_9BILA